MSVEEYKNKYPNAILVSDAFRLKISDLVSGMKNPNSKVQKRINIEKRRIIDSNENKIQCLECGDYYKRIMEEHLLKHNMDMKEYKEKYSDAILTSESTRQKTIIKSTNRKASDATKELMSKSHKGKLHTKEHNENVSKAKRGKKKTDEHRKKLSEVAIESYKNGKIPWNKGKKMSEEFCANVSKAIKEKNLDLVYKNKLRIGHLNYLFRTNLWVYPAYNSKACEFFDFLNFHLGWNG